MSTTETRLRELAQQHLGLDRDPNFDGKLADSGVSSLNAVAFMKLVEKEFGLSLSAADWSNIGTLRGLVDQIDS